MGTFVRLLGSDELQPGQMKRIDLKNRRLLVANVAGDFCVADDMCTHEDASLTLGCLRGDLIKCPLHGSRFNLRTGEVLDEPADENLRIYPARVEDGAVWADLGE